MFGKCASGFVVSHVVCLLVRFLNAELFPERYWRGPRSHKVGTIPHAADTVTTTMTPTSVPTDSNESHFTVVSSTMRGKVHKQCPQKAISLLSLQ